MTTKSVAHLAVLPLLILYAHQPDEPQSQTGSESSVGILIFGDTGYHPQYPEDSDYEDRFTEEQYLASEWEVWLEDKRPPDEYRPRPSEVSPVTGGVIPATGMYAVSAAMTEYCRSGQRCDIGVLLGDNIYPSGATLGADGVDDARRFKDMLQDPLGNLVESPAHYRTYVTLGNHDWETSRAGGFAQIRYLETAPGFYIDGPFYAATPPAGNDEIELFVIDTSMILATTDVREASLNNDGSEGSPGHIEEPGYFVDPMTAAERNQVQWLETELARSTARWKLVLGHHPLWSSAGSKYEEARTLRRLLMPALCRYADAYLAGHEHTLEIHTDNCETVLEDPAEQPLVQIISGAGAKQRPLHSSFMGHQDEQYPQHQTLFAEGLLWGFSHMQLDGDSATVIMLSVRNDDQSTTTPVFEYSFDRRSHRAAGQNN